MSANKMVTKSDLQDFYQGIRPYLNGSANDYSTTEKVVGRWIDGSPLYQITLTKTIPSTGNKSWHSFSDFDVSNKTFVDVRYILLDSGNFTAFGRDTYSGSGASAMFTYKSANINIRENALQIYIAYVTAAEVTVYVTLQYIKTT